MNGSPDLYDTKAGLIVRRRDRRAASDAAAIHNNITAFALDCFSAEFTPLTQP
jgi:hypothetical protein